VIWVGPTGFLFGINGFQSHKPHQSLNALAVDLVAQPTQIIPHGATAPCRRFEILFIDKFHQFQIYGFYRPLFIVICRSIDIQQSALSENTQILIGRIDHFLPRFAVQKPSLRDKKSFATLSSPI
jgi:hypothetical protein